jgi:hypothetical protein
MGLVLLDSMHGITRALQGSETNDELEEVTDVLLAEFDVFLELGGTQVKLQLSDGEAYIDGRPIEKDVDVYAKVTDLTACLGQFGVGDVAITAGLDRAQLDAFTEELKESLRVGSSQFQEGTHPDLLLAKGGGKSMATFRFEPDRLAILLHSSFLASVEEIYRRHDEGESPSLLPVRRILQFIIQAMREQSGIFQVLTTLRDPGTPLGRSRLRTAIAIEAIGFGLFAGLPNLDLMILALSAILRGLSGDAPFTYPRLGTETMALVLCVRDTRAVRDGGSGGVPGRMLAVVEVYQELIAGTAAAIAPSEALRRMATGTLKGVGSGSADAFEGYKGTHPLGSAIQLSDGSLAIVVSQGDEPIGRDAPTVARYSPGAGLSKDWVDLRETPGLRITGAATHPGLQLLAT